MIPKTIHIVWIGDSNKKPKQCVFSWVDRHRDWTICLWEYGELQLEWKCRKQIERMLLANKLEGVADIWRYEILNSHGGVYVDADAECLKPLDSLLDNEMFACYESEERFPDQISNGIIGSEPGHPVLRELIERISAMDDPLRLNGRRAKPWQTVGPKLFTEVVNNHRDHVTVLPSISFIPKHYMDKESRDESQSYARHHWGTTLNLYGKLE